MALLSLYAQKLNINCNIWGYDTFEDGFLVKEFSLFDKDSKGKDLNLKNFTIPNDFYFSKTQVYEVIKNSQMIFSSYFGKGVGLACK